MSNEWKILMLNKKMLCGTFHFYLFQLHLKGLYAKCIGQSDIWHRKVDIKKDDFKHFCKWQKYW